MAIYTNLYLLVFLPVVLIIYQLVPKKRGGEYCSPPAMHCTYHSASTWCCC